jgi:hypothetical protein
VLCSLSPFPNSLSIYCSFCPKQVHSCFFFFYPLIYCNRWWNLRRNCLHNGWLHEVLFHKVDQIFNYSTYSFFLDMHDISTKVFHVMLSDIGDQVKLKNTTQFWGFVFIKYEDDQWWSISGKFQNVQFHLLHDYQKTPSIKCQYCWNKILLCYVKAYVWHHFLHL